MAERCLQCEITRFEMKLLGLATLEWAQHPTGPNITAVAERMRKEAIERGEYPK